MTRRNTPHVTEINLVKGHEPGVRQRQPSHPLIEPRDTEAPEKLLEPEREHIYRELHEHDERIHALEDWQHVVEASQSIPAKFDVPGKFSITGSWKLLAVIAVLVTIVAVLYIVVRYG